MRGYPSCTKPFLFLRGGIFYFHKKKYKKSLTSKTKDIVDNPAEYRQIAYAILKEIADQYINHTYGVYLRKIGYLCVWRSPQKKIRNMYYEADGKGRKLMPNHHTDGYQYHLSLITKYAHRKPLYGWSMDRAFKKNIKRGVSKNLLRGVKYKVDFKLVRTFIERKKIDK